MHKLHFVPKCQPRAVKTLRIANNNNDLNASLSDITTKFNNGNGGLVNTKTTLTEPCLNISPSPFKSYVNVTGSRALSLPNELLEPTTPAYYRDQSGSSSPKSGHSNINPFFEIKKKPEHLNSLIAKFDLLMASKGELLSSHSSNPPLSHEERTAENVNNNSDNTVTPVERVVSNGPDNSIISSTATLTGSQNNTEQSDEEILQSKPGSGCDWESEKDTLLQVHDTVKYREATETRYGDKRAGHGLFQFSKWNVLRFWPYTEQADHTIREEARLKLVPKMEMFFNQQQKPKQRITISNLTSISSPKSSWPGLVILIY